MWQVTGIGKGSQGQTRRTALPRQPAATQPSPAMAMSTVLQQNRRQEGRRGVLKLQ